MAGLFFALGSVPRPAYLMPMIRAYILHMARSTARAPLVAALRDGLPAAQVVEAVDGRALSDAARAACAPGPLLEPRYPFALLPSEIGCFLSHRRAWEALVASDAALAYVAEDDVTLGAGFGAARALAEAHATPASLIRFPMAARETPQRHIAEARGARLFRPRTIGLTAALYLLGRDAAQVLLTGSARFDRPVDTWLQMRWETGVDSLTLWPSGIASAAPAHGGSTIQAAKPAGLAKLRREWQRARYRAAIKRRAARP